MLNDIRVHIHSNEEVQEEIEVRSAVHIEKTHKQNKLAFSKYIPSLINELHSISSSNVSIFCNQNEEYNIVDFGLGRTLYGESPLAEIAEQCQQMPQHSAYLTLSCSSPGAPNAKEAWQSDDAEQVLQAYQTNATFVEIKATTADVLVVLGLGLGHHIDWLIEHCSAKHVIIYEPERQYFKSSCMVKDWQSVLEKVMQTGTSLYFQIGKSSQNVIQDLSELSTQVDVGDVMLFQHYYEPTFDAVMHAFRTQSWQEMTASSAPFSMQGKFTQYTPPWLDSPNVHSLSVVSNEQSRFQTNLAAFLQYYPNIHAEFADYKPQTWVVVENQINQINLFNRDNGACLYGKHPAEDGHKHYKSFEKFPNKDGLILGYKGEKLKHYYHYRLVKKTEQLLLKAEDEAGFLPDTIKSLILFGLGAGYQLESLFEHKELEKLFICEPNRDFFYASLFAIDWAKILEKVDESGANLYINIGDDGTHLFRDLLGQFYNIGPYVLSQTFFYQGYYNAALNASIMQLREQLQIVVAMGEYFDHACYAIEHTKEALRNNIPFLRAKPSQYLSNQQRELPIIFVGNGPSLDYSIDTIRELKERAIIVSCGTSLQALQRNNITPDFHAEIELNRATYDWAYRVDDLEFLKKITLLSCNGIHPDTCNLYKNVKFAFKEGESATVSMLNVIGADKAESLEFSFPTVSNFAINLFLKLGFNQIYLFGVDMGFVDNQKHHASQSGYYTQQGKELYKYTDENNTGLLVPGNFRPVVSTKYEFKLAKTIIEQALAAHKIDCYNTSDGARIEGASALNIDNILLMSTPDQKQDVLQNLESCFCTLPADKVIDDFENKYDSQLVLDEISQLQIMLQSTISDQDDVFNIIEKQKQFLFHSYKKGNSLFFYYFYGTMNYINSVLSKAAMHQNLNIAVDVAQQTIEIWNDSLGDVKLLLQNTNKLFDTSSSFPVIRERLVLRKQDTCQLSVNTFEPQLSHLVTECLSTLATIYPITYSVHTIKQSSEQYSISSAAAGKEPSAIFCVQNKQDWKSVTSCLEKRDEHAQMHNYAGNVLICLMGEYQSIWFEQVAIYTHLVVSFQVLPQVLELSSAADYKQGRIPFSPLNLHLESAIKHLHDTADYSIFIEKLDFSDVGLKNALKTNETAELNKTENLAGVRYENDVSEKSFSEDTKVSDALTSSLKVSLEGGSAAHKYIERNIVELISAPAFIDYKTYIGIPRKAPQLTANATVCDSANSRGLKVNRQFDAVELFQIWQTQSVVESNISVYTKAK
jgi:hypothetical protein